MGNTTTRALVFLFLLAFDSINVDSILSAGVTAMNSYYILWKMYGVVLELTRWPVHHNMGCVHSRTAPKQDGKATASFVIWREQEDLAYLSPVVWSVCILRPSTAWRIPVLGKNRGTGTVLSCEPLIFLGYILLIPLWDHHSSATS